MLAPVIATEDPYAAASIFSAAGWKVESESDRLGSHPRAAVSLAHARIVLVTPPASEVLTGPRGAGVELQLYVPPHELSGLFLLHRALGLVVGDLRTQRSGERGFHAEIVGYRFLILAGEPDPDLATIATDPRIMGLADGLRQRDGVEGLTDAALRLVEGAGESVRHLRQAIRAGMRPGSGAEVSEDLAEVVIAAAILARQLGLDLEADIQAKLGSPTWISEAWDTPPAPMDGRGSGLTFS